MVIFSANSPAYGGGERRKPRHLSHFLRQECMHVGIRTQADLVYDHLFNDVLKDGRMTVRFSVGTCFNFGKKY